MTFTQPLPRKGDVFVKMLLIAAISIVFPYIIGRVCYNLPELLESLVFFHVIACKFTQILHISNRKGKIYDEYLSLLFTPLKAARHSERGAYRRQDGDNQLDDEFPSLTFHDIHF